jgi:hypothetical protein
LKVKDAGIQLRVHITIGDGRQQREDRIQRRQVSVYLAIYLYSVRPVE